MIERGIVIKNLSGEVLNKLDITKINGTDSKKEFIYLEKLEDDKWRLTYTKKTIEDFSKVSSFDIWRKNV